jgi:DNA-binding NarL/FixJ family response regulator
VAEKERLRVIVADDHEKMKHCLIKILERNFEVISSASNGSDLVDIAVRMRPDVIVSDVQMPVLDGPAAMKALQEKNLDIPFVFVSSDRSVANYVAQEFGICLYKIDVLSELTNAVHSAARLRSECRLL